jgi:hypothetical protein
MMDKYDYSSKPRTLLDPAITIEMELSDKVILVERQYRNLMELCSEIGSILKVLVFFCIVIGIMHLLNIVFQDGT